MSLRRRSFFGAAAAVGSAALASRSASAANALISPPVMRTAVSVVAACHHMSTQDFGVIEAPDGFVPVAVACDDQDVLIRLYDAEGTVFEIHSFAFRYGPIDLWRPVVGELRLEVTPTDALFVLPRPVVTIYGEIDIE